MPNTDHFSIPKAPDFFDDDFELVLTDESKRLFELGRPKQGYIGLVELPSENEVTPEGKKRAYIHLYPSDNKDSGMLYGIDKNGDKLPMVQSSQSLGKNTGDLHLQVASKLGLGEKQGANGYLMGFGIWKSGYGVKILPELPIREALIPGEFILVKEKDRWTLHFSFLVSPPKDIETGKVDLLEIPISYFPGLEEALNALPDKDVSKLTYAERMEIENILREAQIEGLPKEPEGGIGVIKNRSSSQNMYSVKKDELFREYFNNAFLSPRSAHGAQFVRELPLPVLEKIMKNTMQQLGLPVVNDLIGSGLIPGDLSGPGTHLWVERNWIKKSEKEREKAILHVMINRDDFSVMGKMITEIAKRRGTEEARSELLSELLFFSIENKNIDAIFFLLKEGAGINSKNKNGETPLMLACSAGLADVAVELIKRGADVNEKNNDNDTPLMLACRSGMGDLSEAQKARFAKIALELIKSEVDVNAKNNNDTPLELACRAGLADVASELLRRGALASGGSLLAACSSGLADIALELIKRGANVNENSSTGTPLMGAASAGLTQVCLALIQKGADVNAKNFALGNALLCAIRDLNSEQEAICNEICLMLIEKGVDFNIKDFLGNTALSSAASKGFTQVCITLIKAGADPGNEAFRNAILEMEQKEKSKEEMPRKGALVFSDENEPYDTPQLPSSAPPLPPGQVLPPGDEEIKKSDENEPDDPPSPPRPK